MKINKGNLPTSKFGILYQVLYVMSIKVHTMHKFHLTKLTDECIIKIGKEHATNACYHKNSKTLHCWRKQNVVFFIIP